MDILAPLLAEGRAAAAHAPWPRADIGPETWQRVILHLAGGELDLLGLWGEADRVHMAVSAPESHEIAVFTLACPEGRFPSVGLSHPPAIRLERTIQDLFRLIAEGAEDARHWFDHGAWGIGTPLGTPGPAPDHAYAFLPVTGENLHQIPVGPVHAGIIEPGHFRFTADGETIIRLEQRLGYVHKGTEGLMIGAPLDHAARLAGRVSGDATVAYACGFARAAEAALGIAPPPRAIHLRAVMAELERIANHIGDFGAICNDASFALMLAHCSVLRERILRAAHLAFGHRLMMDRVVPGGLSQDITAEGLAAIAGLIPVFRARLDQLAALYDSTASLQERTVTTGFVQPDYVRHFGCGGHVGRASGRLFDSRKWPSYAPYDSTKFDVPLRTDGDVNARVWIRIEEIRQSLAILDHLLATLPPGPRRTALPAPSTPVEGMSLTESFRGDVLIWLRIAPDLTIQRCHARDPSWFQWPLLETCVYGNIVADFPLCNKSFNCSYSGTDL